MHTASSANRTCRLSLSAVEYTATVLIPISRQVRITRRAISPLLAISTFLNILRIIVLRRTDPGVGWLMQVLPGTKAGHILPATHPLSALLQFCLLLRFR